ncbi:zinc finger protein 92-like isoform X2 [Spodoptera litura]|uniref:Zinc finger protein 92-like isoform X2 n=1 Tax=Spodoptera litura TaxID=69820 RepID=A0A9J7IYY6_SPOLT|nr:zinc finger protein 92-like isoform X2 [Spodoptera litura]
MKLKLKPVIKLQKLAVHICDKCKKVFRTPSDLEEHSCHYDKRFYEHVASAYVSVERMPVHKCNSCDQNFETNTEYLRHKFEHVEAHVRKKSAMERKLTNGHILKSYKCPDCDIKFAAQSTLDLHSIVHMPYPHICYCGVGYYKQKDLKAHIKLVHSNDKAIEEIKSSNNSIPMKTQTITETQMIKERTLNSVLLEKKKCFKNNVKLKSNKNDGITKEIEFMKTDDNKYKCPLCKGLFKTRLSVCIHYRIHSNDRVHACYLCAEVMTTTDSLRLHMKEHHNTNKICVS